MTKKFLFTVLLLTFVSVNGFADIINCKSPNATFEMSDLDADNASTATLFLDKEIINLNCYLFDTNDTSARICISARKFAKQYEVSIHEMSPEKILGSLVVHLGFHSWETPLECSYQLHDLR